MARMVLSLLLGVVMTCALQGRGARLVGCGSGVTWRLVNLDRDNRKDPAGVDRDAGRRIFHLEPPMGSDPFPDPRQYAREQIAIGKGAISAVSTKSGHVAMRPSQLRNVDKSVSVTAFRVLNRHGFCAKLDRGHSAWLLVARGCASGSREPPLLAVLVKH